MNLDTEHLKTLFSQEKLDAIFPSERTHQFFDALLGDADEGAYDIRLAYNGFQDAQLQFDLQLHSRPGKCLACNLTYGLPTVFERHPAINIKGIVEQIGQLLDGQAQCRSWKLGRTTEVSRQLHVITLVIDIVS